MQGEEALRVDYLNSIGSKSDDRHFGLHIGSGAQILHPGPVDSAKVTFLQTTFGGKVVSGILEVGEVVSFKTR